MKYSIILALTLSWLGPANAEPGATWKLPGPSTVTHAASIDGVVLEFARQYRPTAIMVVQNDLVVATSGDVAHKVNVRSVRKSLLSALFGIAIERNLIKIDRTLDQLGVDDTAPSLTAEEKQATVRQLLMSRSGVYHPAAYETREMKLARPPRGSHAPGTFWYYNNWDFNALGTIYAKETGEDIFKSFERAIARPIGMEDFTARDGRYVEERLSNHRAYVFSMTARDLARFSLLFLNQGRWNGAQIVPSGWVVESTKAHSETDRRDRGYGYLWWTLNAKEWGHGTAFALGYGGQLIVILPEKRLIAVEVVELDRTPKGIRSANFLELVRKIAALVP
jgi:CubicO group peptidase (beta-lactamase class C family)